MDYLKEAFRKVKEDIISLRKEINFLKQNINENNEKISQFSEITNIVKEIRDKLNLFQINSSTDRQTIQQTDKNSFPTYPTHTPTHKDLFNPLKPQFSSFSTGNRGASTDRQTDNPTDRQTQLISSKEDKTIKNALEFLNSLDSIKKEIRLKFKRITDQEFLVFSTIYQMDEEYGGTDYKTLSKRLNLSESSIRDYVGRLLKKEIPIEKIKINNKNIQLSISQNLKKIVSLPTIFQLREI